MTGVVQLVMQLTCVSQMLTWCALVQLGFAGGHHWVSLPGHIQEIAGCIRSLGQASFMWDIGRSVDINTDVESNDADVRL